MNDDTENPIRQMSMEMRKMMLAHHKAIMEHQKLQITQILMFVLWLAIVMLSLGLIFWLMCEDNSYSCFVLHTLLYMALGGAGWLAIFGGDDK